MINIINYKQLIADLTPDPLLHSYSGNTTLLNEKLFEWNNLIWSGATDDNNWFINYANDTYFKVYHNGQLQSLEHFLNNEWSNSNTINYLGFPNSGTTIYTSGGTILTNGQIYIEDGPSSIYTYLYNDGEVSATEFTYLYNDIESGTTGYTATYLYNDIELLGNNSPDFIVYVPLWIYNINTFYTLIYNAVELYKPGGTKFIIVSY